MRHEELLKLMCRVVTVTATLERTAPSDKRERWWEREELPEPRTGWIVGHRWLQQGRRDPGSPTFYGVEGTDYGEPPSFEETGPRTPCLLVAWWPTQKAVRVPLDGWRLPTATEAPRSPQYRWTDKDRRQMSLEAVHFERDRKGRFA